MRPVFIAAAFIGLSQTAATAQTLADLPLRAPVYHRVPGSASPIPGPGPYMPARAAAERVHGEVVIACVLSAKGKLDPCRVVNETPAGYGFSQAALEMAANRHVTAKPSVVDGKPKDGELVRVKIEFDGATSRM